MTKPTFLNQGKTSTLWPYLIALIAGGLLPLAFAPTHIFWLSIVCPAALISLWLRATAKKSAGIGFLFGLSFFGVGVSWIFNSIYVYGNTNILIAFLITFAFVSVLASFFALNGYLLQKFFAPLSVAKLLIAFPGIWVLLEWLRSWIFTGFPWLLLGHSAVSSPISGMIPIIGVYGLSFLILVLSGLLVLAANPRITNPTGETVNWGKSNIAGFALLILIGFANFSHYLHWTSLNPTPLRTSIVQGNIAQELRWDPTEVQAIIQRYQSISKTLTHSQLLVWPEAAIPLTPTQAPLLYAEFAKAALANHASLLLGAPILSSEGYHNSVIALGTGTGTYFKRHLVPFGEYIPFEQQLRGLIGFFNLPMSDLIAGEVKQPLISVDGIPTGVFICYEIAYNALVRQDLPMAQFLVTVSDDAWFGHSLAPWQHLQIAQFQAAATSRSMIFASNTGSSAFIDSKGIITLSIPPDVAGSATFNVVTEQGATPWVRLGDTPFLILITLLLAWAYRRCRRHNV